MGWFSKKENKKKEIPVLPKLPELPRVEGGKNGSALPELPSFPTNSLGEKFSQNTIKEAVTGEKEGEGAFETSQDEKNQALQRHLKKPLTKEISYLEKEERKIPFEGKSVRIPEKFNGAAEIVKKSEPIFIRIDKFEESLHIFEKIKKQILDIEKMLKNTKTLKEEEDKELEFWEKEIQIIKGQIEKVDGDIFSKIK